MINNRGEGRELKIIIIKINQSFFIKINNNQIKN